jgi:hypothetical protein
MDLWDADNEDLDEQVKAKIQSKLFSLLFNEFH